MPASAPPAPTTRTGKMQPRMDEGRRIGRPDARYQLRLLSPTALQMEIQRAPIRTLIALRAVHPMLSQADDNDLGLLNQPGDIRIVAVKPGSAGAEDDEVDDALTDALDALWDTAPNGLVGLMDGNITAVSYTGMCAVRGLVSESGRELLGVEPLKTDGAHFLFTREPDRTGYQAWYRPDVNAIRWEWLDPETGFWASLGGEIGNPYGVARRAPALWEIYRDLQLNDDMRDVFRTAAMPRIVVKLDHSKMLEYARQMFPSYTDLDLQKWLQDEVDAMAAGVSTLRADDYLVVDITATVEAIEGGKGLGNQQEYLQMFQRRLIQSIGTQPFMVGMNDTTTETQAREQFKLQALVLERVRACALEPLRRIANLHLRLMGSPAVARVEYEPIRTTDALIEAQTAQIELQTAGQRAAMGIDSMDTVAQDVSGSGLADEEQAQKWLDANTAPKQGGGGGSTLDAVTAARQRRNQRRNGDRQEQDAEGEGAQ